MYGFDIFHFSDLILGMQARTMLAALDNNNHNQREHASCRGKKRYNVIFPKGRKTWVARPIYDAKQYKYIPGMLAEVVRSVNKNSTPELENISVPVNIPVNIATIPKPQKEEVVENKFSRMEKAINLSK